MAWIKLGPQRGWTVTGMLIQEPRGWRWRGRLGRLVSCVTGGIPIVETPLGLAVLSNCFCCGEIHGRQVIGDHSGWSALVDVRLLLQ